MSETSYKAWSTTVYLRRAYEWTTDSERVPVGYSEPVAVIFDPRGWAWHVTLGDDGSVSSLTIESLGAPVDETALRTAPLEHLAEVARDALGVVDELAAEGGSLDAALAAASAAKGFVTVEKAPPPPELFAAYWNALPKKDSAGRTRRWQAAAHWGYSVHYVDKWLREARDLSLIALPTRIVKRSDLPAATTKTTTKKGK